MENVEPSSSKRKRSEYSVWKKGGAKHLVNLIIVTIK